MQDLTLTPRFRLPATLHTEGLTL